MSHVTYYAANGFRYIIQVNDELLFEALCAVVWRGSVDFRTFSRTSSLGHPPLLLASTTYALM